jgi:hypothetical protein
VNKRTTMASTSDASHMLIEYPAHSSSSEDSFTVVGELAVNATTTS